MASNFENMSAEDVAKHLNLSPHPEGGWFRRTYRHADELAGRPIASAIYYLITGDRRSHWHRLDADELWHWYGGASLELWLSGHRTTESSIILGPNLTKNEEPQRLVPKGMWQCCTSLGDWTLVGCTVSPAFSFAGFEMLPDA